MDRYCFWLEQAFRQPVDRQAYFRSLIEGKPISAANLRLAHLLLSGEVPALVVTPNFDDFLARALRLFGKPYVSCDHPAVAERIDPEGTDIQILHVHGTYLFYDLRNLKGELKERARTEPVHQTIASRLDMILSNRSPIVIGYSGWTDDVFMTALHRRLSAYTLKYNLYWFCYRREDAELLPEFLRGREDVVVVVPGTNTARPRIGQSDAEEETSAHASAADLPKARAPGDATAVFEEMIRQLDLPAPPLTENPIRFYAKQLRSSLVSSPASDLAVTEDFYGIGALVDRLDAMASDWAGEGAPARSMYERELEAIRDAVRRSQYREALAQAAAIRIQQVPASQLEALAESVWTAATRLLDDSDDELAGYDIVLAAVDTLTAAKQTPSPRLRQQEVGALLNKAITLDARGRTEDALRAYDEVVGRFGDSEDPTFRTQVALALANKGLQLTQLGRGEDALAVYEEVVRRFGDSEDPALHKQVGRALANKGFQLGELGRGEDALAAYDEVIGRFGDSDDPALREQVAGVLANKGVQLGQLGRGEEALAAYDEVVRRFGDSDDPALREQVARVLAAKGFQLGQLDRGEDALAAYDEVVRRFTDSDDPALREQVVLALANKIYRLGVLDRPDEAVSVADETVNRFTHDENPAIRARVAMGVTNKAEALLRAKRFDESLAACEEAFELADADNSLPMARQAYAEALITKGDVFRSCGDRAAAASAYDEAVRMFSDDLAPEVRKVANIARDRLDEFGGEGSQPES
jgi:tetratricopeptide (TPR) repeat protein